MNYKENYFDYINYIKNQNRKLDYFEIHHIIPRCIGGGNHKENLIALTAREHILAHYLLCKIYKSDKRVYPKMVASFKLMLTISNQARQNNFSARKYEYFKKLSSQMLSESKIGTKTTEETKRKLSNIKKEYYKNNGGTFRGKQHSEQSRELMKEAKLFKIKCVENHKIYNTYLEAAEDLNICTPDIIGRQVAGKIKSACGFHFERTNIKKEHPKHTKEWTAKITLANKKNYLQKKKKELK